MIIRLLFTFICGFFLLALIAPYDSWVKYHIGEQFKKVFSQAMDCSIEGDLVAVNIIFPSLTLKNVRVKDRQCDSWSWKCEEYSTGFSWIHFFKTKMVDMWVEISDMYMHSTVSGKTIHVLSHLKRIINPSGAKIPLQFKHFILNKGFLVLQDADNHYQATFCCNGKAKSINNSIKMYWDIFDGKGTSSRCTWHSTAGTISCDIHKKKDKTTGATVTFDLSTSLKGSDKERVYFFSGGYQDSQAKFSLQTDDGSVSISPCIVTCKEGLFLQCFGQSTCKELLWIVMGKRVDVGGHCYFTVKGPLSHNKKIKIHAAIYNCIYKNYVLTKKITIDVIIKNQEVRGFLSGTLLDNTLFTSSLRYNLLNHSGSWVLHNNNTIKSSLIDRWSIKAQGLKIDAHYNPNSGISLTYDCVFSHRTSEKNHHVAGSVSYCSSKGTLKGEKDENGHYEACFSFDTYPYVHSFSYQQDTVSLLKVYATTPTITLDCNFLLIKNVLASWFDHEIQAEGNMHMECSFDKESVGAHCMLSKGIIRLPQTYNFIDGGNAEFTYFWNSKQLHVRKIDGSMHCGTFSLEDGSLFFDSEYKPSFIHMPLIFNRCLFNMKRDLFIMASGGLLLEKRGDMHPMLSGSIILERGQIKENILSQEFQRQVGLFSTKVFTLSSSLMNVDLSLHSRQGIKIDTPFLKTKAKVSLHLTDCVTQPALSGTITLLGGSLQFPYKPLSISRGTLTFNAEKGYDPTVEIVARNQVRNHRIAFYVTGSLLDHHITLESSPSLTDEQIIGLLLAGSAQESLKNMMPTLIMNNLKSLIFGSNQFNFLNKYFRPLGSAVSINLIPSFTDQSGRGGLRGALEISVNDRWRALIQKNFSFTEDTRFELEYLFADDITLRAVRDEQKNVGFEAEMKWKF